MILGKVNIPYKVNDIEFCGSLEVEQSSLYDLIMHLASIKSIIIHEEKIAYTEDIRANYRDGELYIPMLSYKTIREGDIEANYDNKIEKVYIHSFNQGLLLDTLWVVPNITIPKAYSINIQRIKLSRTLDETSIQARDLFNKYVAYSHGYNSNDIDVFDFIKVQKQYIKNSQRKLLRKHNLEFYGDYIDMDYRDVREWKLQDLQKSIPEDIIKTNIPFGVRRLAFELELYSRIYDQLYWEGWTLGTMSELLSNKIDYLKYKKNGIYLIFKRRWIKRVC